MGVVYDEAKRQVTLDARRLDFAEAGVIFTGPMFTLPDERGRYGEPRYITYGMGAGCGRLDVARIGSTHHFIEEGK